MFRLFLCRTQKNRRLQHEQTASTLAQPSVQHESSSILSIKARVVLSLEQQKILSLVVQEGKSLFFTGSVRRSLTGCECCDFETNHHPGYLRRGPASLSS